MPYRPDYLAIDLGPDCIQWGAGFGTLQSVRSIRISQAALAQIPAQDRARALVRDTLTYIRDHEGYALPTFCVVTVPYLTSRQHAQIEQTALAMGVSYVRVIKRISAFALAVNGTGLNCGEYEQALMVQLRRELSEGCVSFSQPERARNEELAMLDDELTEAYLESETLTDGQIAELVRTRAAFPCLFGSALKIEGVAELLQALDRYTAPPNYPEQFGARVYKIARDAQGTRLTFLKITGGSLKVKTPLGQEKVDQIRIYSGEKYKTADLVQSGMLCAVTGLDTSFVGMGLGIEVSRAETMLRPTLEYRITPQDGTDVHTLWQKLRAIAEEDPALRLSRREGSGEICAALMGDVQIAPDAGNGG